jgi:hypothetical protein
VIDIYLDPIILGCPVNADQEALHSYAEQMLTLNAARQATCSRFTLSATASETLVQANVFPLYSSLERLETVARSDVLKIVNNILTKSLIAEDRLGIRDILVEQPSCSPDSHLQGELPSFEDAHHRNAALIALQKNVIRCTDHSELGTPMMLTSIPEGAYHSAQYRGDISIIDCEPDIVLPDTPYSYLEDIYLLGHPSDIVQCLPIERLMIDHSAFEDAVNSLVIQQRQQGLLRDWPPKQQNWSMGTEFRKTLEEHGFCSDPSKARSLLRAVVDTITNQNMSATHAIRMNAQGGTAQRLRKSDKARAYRRDIDYEFHLHYWETTNGPAFASVVVHSDFFIPED